MFFFESLFLTFPAPNHQGAVSGRLFNLGNQFCSQFLPVPCVKLLSI